MSRVHVNGVDLDYVEEGTGVPVVFSHGGSSDLRYWEPQRQAFAAAYRFVAYSRRFHGAGARHTSNDNSTETHVADLVEIIHLLQIRPVHLVGFSTTLALRTALAAPGLIRSLTVIEPNVPWLLDQDEEDRTILAQWRADNERIAAEAGRRRRVRRNVVVRARQQSRAGGIRCSTRGVPPHVARQLR